MYPGGEAWRGRDGSTGLLPGFGGPCAGRGVPALGTTTQGAPAPALSDDTGSALVLRVTVAVFKACPPFRERSRAEGRRRGAAPAASRAID